MTREEFIGLPASVALGILWDTSPALAAKLADIEAPKPARSPKYDAIIYRRDGIQWASETDVEGLRWWHQRYTESANGGGQYADKDAKRAKALDFWIAWRLAEPQTRWQGERNNAVVTAQPPSGKPTVYPRDQQGGQEPQRSAAPAFSDDYGDAYDGPGATDGDDVAFNRVDERAH
jgi:hypothetical protein